MWRAAARRFVILLGIVSTGIVVVSFLLGLLFDSAADRSISLGFYFVGAFLAFAGFFLGNRGPMRPVGEEGNWRVGRGLRRASKVRPASASRLSPSGSLAASTAGKKNHGVSSS